MQQILLMRQDLAKSNLKSYGAILTFPPCNKFILPTSPNTSYSDLVMEECKLVASVVHLHRSYYSLVKNKVIQE